MPRANDDTALTVCSVPSDQEENVHLSNDRRCGFKTVALISESHDDQPIRQLFVACPLITHDFFHSIFIAHRSTQCVTGVVS